MFILGICPRRCIFWIVLSFVKTSQFQALSLGWLPSLVGNRLVCLVAQTCSPYVPCIPWLSLSAQGVRSGLLQVSTPWTPHSHWSINVSLSRLLLLVIRQSWEVWVLVSLQGLSWLWLLPPQFFLALLVVSTVGSSHGKTCLICWIGSSKLYWWHWNVDINCWLENFMSILVGTVNPFCPLAPDSVWY